MSDRPRVGELLRAAAAIGLATGFLEAAFRLAQRLAGRRTFLSEDVAWMAPVADLVLFVLVALVALGVARALGRRLDRRVFFGLLAFVAALGPILAFPRIHPAAGIVLAAGLGTAAGRGLGGRRGPVRWAGRALVPLLALLFVALAGARGRERLAERRALASLPDADPGAPDVVLLILDTVRAGNLGLYGYRLPTSPRLEALDGTIVFDRAWATAPWTLPSHVGFLTGLFPYQTRADWLTPLEAGPTTLAEYLAGRGYATGAFVANLIYTTEETGLARGFSRYEDYPISAAMIANSAWVPRRIAWYVTAWLGRERFLVHKKAERVNDDFLGWLDDHPDRPVFAFLNYMDAHAPYVPPDSLYDRFGPRRTWRAQGDLMWRDEWTAGDLDAERAAYDGAIAYLDAEIGRLLDELRRRGRLDRTLLVIASDHGEQLGEHGLVDHGNSLYRPLLQVPLVLRLPGARGPRLRVGPSVSLRDLPATVADLLGDEGRPFPGRSLRDRWEAPEADAPAGALLSEVSRGIRMEAGQPAAIGDMRSLILEGHHYILNGDGREELYALRDVGETIDLGRRPELAPLLERARATLDTLR